MELLESIVMGLLRCLRLAAGWLADFAGERESEIAVDQHFRRMRRDSCYRDDFLRGAQETTEAREAESE